MSRIKVLYVCHNHPSVRPGGAEAYAYEVFQAMRQSPDFEPTFVAKGGPPLAQSGRVHMGTYLSPIESADAEYFLFTDGYDYDWLFGTMRHSKELYTKHFREFLLAARPDVVHFQHVMGLGYELIRETRNTLPDAPILMTLHEFLPICHRMGQMVRTVKEELCTHESPRRCHECFPAISPQTFFMRKRFIQAQLELVDLFLAPSRFLLERYVAWGIPPDRIRFEEYGRFVNDSRLGATHDSSETKPRNRLGFFGQLTPFKGVHVLMKAMALLEQEGRLTGRGDGAQPLPHLSLHGANLDIQTTDFQEEFNRLLAEAKETVTLVGRYEPQDIPTLMAKVDWVVVPSIWWENSPLVIQEAFQNRRPVICSDIGGMAEKVAHGVSGLHFRVGDAGSLAETIREAVGSSKLWSELRRGIPEPYRMEQHIAVLGNLYRDLMAARLEGRNVGVA